jgi:hypothetical protein
MNEDAILQIDKQEQQRALQYGNNHPYNTNANPNHPNAVLVNNIPPQAHPLQNPFNGGGGGDRTTADSNRRRSRLLLFAKLSFFAGFFMPAFWFFGFYFTGVEHAKEVQNWGAASLFALLVFCIIIAAGGLAIAFLYKSVT